MTNCPDPNAPVPAPVPMLAAGVGGWSFPIFYVDPADNPVDLSAGTLTPVAYFYQGNTDTTTQLTVLPVSLPSGQVTAVVPSSVVLSTLYPTPGPRLLGGFNAISAAQPPTFRLYAYLLDSQGNRTSETVIAVQPVDWRTAPAGTLPTPPATYVAVGPAGAKGAQGTPGVQGNPGGIVPYSGQAAGPITQYGVVAESASGPTQASSANLSQVGTVVGVATVAAGTGQSVTWVGLGPVDNLSWNWTPGPVYFDNTGALTQTAPSSSGSFRQSVGTAVTATRLVVQIGEAEVIE